MSKIFLTRHGETEWNTSGLVQGSLDSPLTAAGVEQAKRLADRLAGEDIELVFSSPLGRAVSTAAVIAAKLDLPVVECEEFREISFGTWEGQAWQDLQHSDPKGFISWTKTPYLHRFPRGESMGDVLARAKAKLLQLYRDHPARNLCVVSHGVTLKVMVTDLMGFDLKDWERTPWQPNTALNIFEINNGIATGLVLGDNSHVTNRKTAGE